MHYDEHVLEAGAEPIALGLVPWLNPQTGAPHPSPPNITEFVLFGDSYSAADRTSIRARLTIDLGKLDEKWTKRMNRSRCECGTGLIKAPDKDALYKWPTCSVQSRIAPGISSLSYLPRSTIQYRYESAMAVKICFLLPENIRECPEGTAQITGPLAVEVEPSGM
jgi:hypothetical protein